MLVKLILMPAIWRNEFFNLFSMKLQLILLPSIRNVNLNHHVYFVMLVSICFGQLYHYIRSECEYATHLNPCYPQNWFVKFVHIAKLCPLTVKSVSNYAKSKFYIIVIFFGGFPADLCTQPLQGQLQQAQTLDAKQLATQ